MAPLVWPTSGAAAVTDLGGGGDLGVGHAQHDGVAAGGPLAAPDRPLDLHAGIAKRPRERGADAAGADYAHPQGAF